MEPFFKDTGFPLSYESAAGILFFEENAERAMLVSALSMSIYKYPSA